MKKSTLFLMLLLLFLVGVIGGFFFAKTKPKEVACTKEAKLCPDGSSVGRTGPNCEFNPCPSSVKDNSCKSDSDCGVNICDCVAMRKDTIQTKDLACTRYCPGTPKCISGTCQLVQQ